MNTLRERNTQTAEILATFGATSTGPPDEPLEKLLDQAASHITNPYMRSGFKKALEMIISTAQQGLDEGQILRRDAEARDIYFTPRLKLTYRQWLILTTSSSRTMRSLFGDIRIHTNTFETVTERESGGKQSNNVTQNVIRIIFRPAAWLVRFGLAYELQLGLFGSVRNWKTTFQVFQPVPDDSLIFEFCRSGNIQGVQTLLSRKQASVWDTNSYGWTPLHVCFLLIRGSIDAKSYKSFTD